MYPVHLCRLQVEACGRGPQAVLSTAVRIVVDYRSALRARTGVGQTAFHLVRALAEVARQDVPGTETPPSLDVTVFSSSWKDRPAAADLAQLPGVRVVDRRVPVKTLNFLWHQLGWPPVELLTGGRFDVAYSPHPLLMPASGAAQVVMIHDLDFLLHPERVAAEIRRDYPRLVRDHAHRAAHVLVPSHYTARQVENELGLPAEHMTVCYPGTPDWTPAPDRSSARLGRHVLFVGTLEKRKNVGTLLGAYADLVGRWPAAPPLVLAGRARPEAAAWLEATGRPPLAGRVRYLGYVSEEQRRELFESAALLVLPSYEEGFGMPALEAMAIGVPVVVSNRGALPEVVGDAALVVDPDDRDALSGAMERMLTDDGFAAAAAAKGIQRARRFRWANTAATAIGAFERAMQARAR
jgi:glycosyltransferase involved in cell wall biosynthesis